MASVSLCYFSTSTATPAHLSIPGVMTMTKLKYFSSSLSRSCLVQRSSLDRPLLDPFLLVRFYNGKHIVCGGLHKADQVCWALDPNDWGFLIQIGVHFLNLVGFYIPINR